MDNVTTALLALFADAVNLATRAKAELSSGLTVPSKRGGPRLHPAVRAWDVAVQNATRLARELARHQPSTAPSLDDELDSLLGGAE